MGIRDIFNTSGGRGDSRSPLGSAVFVLVLALPMFANLAFGGVSSGSFAFVTALTAVVAILWAVRSLKDRDLKITLDPAMIAIGGLLLLGLLQLLPIADPGVPDGVLSSGASRALSVEPNATRLAIIKLLVFGVYFAAALTFVDTRSRIRKLVVTLMVFGSLMSFFAVLQFLSDPTTIYGLTPAAQARPFGSYVNQHHFASFLVMIFALCLAMLLGGGTKRNKLVFFLIATLLIGTGVIFTGSRGAFLSLVAVLAFLALTFFLLNRRSVRLHGDDEGRHLFRSVWVLGAASAGLLIGVVLLAIWAGGEQGFIRGAGMQAGDDFSTGRLHFWSVALRIFAANPVIGSGLESFGVAYTRFDSANGMYRIEHAHNDYLQMLSDGGVIGFAFIALFIYFLFRGGIRTIKETQDRLRRSAAVGALAACFGVMVHSLVDFPLRTNANMLFFLVLAVVAVRKIGSRSARDGHQSEKEN